MTLFLRMALNAIDGMMAREHGMKSPEGAVLPGHGGILDRVDSLTYAAPVFTHFFRYFFFP